MQQLSKATPEQKDFVLANLLLTVKELVDLLEKLAQHVPKGEKLNKEIKEIENTISLGIPGWIKYTRKIKKSKK